MRPYKFIAAAGCSLIAFLACARATTEAASVSAGLGEERIHLDGAENGPTRAITLEDIIGLRTVTEPRLSPDGSQVAYLVSQAFRDCNCERTALYLQSSHGQRMPKKLLEADKILNVQWLPDGGSLSFFLKSERSLDLMQVDIRSRTLAKVPEFARANTWQDMLFQPVLDYRWSHDGQSVAFTQNTPRDLALRNDMIHQGYSYDDTNMWSLDIYGKDWERYEQTVTVQVYSLRDHRRKELWREPRVFTPSIAELSWSPDDRLIAFIAKSETFNFLVATVEAAGGKLSVLDDSPSIKEDLRWSPTGDRLLFTAFREGRNVNLVTYDLHKHANALLAADLHISGWVDWDAHGNQIYLLASGLGTQRVTTGLYALPVGGVGAAKRISDDQTKISDCDALHDHETVCVVQSPVHAPAAAIVNVQTGAISTLADINPELQAIRLGPVSELHWNNRFGEQTNGYLLLPSAVTGRAPPLVVMGYGFDGDFVTHASMIDSNYPAQALARDGIAVLLFNCPRWAKSAGDFEQTVIEFGESPLSSLEVIVKKLAAEGVIDPARVGYAGHSFGGFLVEYALEHSNLITAAELHNGGTTVNPVDYTMVGNVIWRNSMNQRMGGPPWGETLKNYVTLSAVLNADKIHAPVMMEYSDMEALEVLDMYGALRQSQVPVDLFVYPDDTHVFLQPEHRYWSMQRNLDWFRFWLQNHEDTDQDKRGQYARWRQFRQALCKDRANTRTYCSPES